MPFRRLVLLSGPIAAGKTTLAEGLAASIEFFCLRARDELERRAELSGASRTELLDVGAELELRTSGGWLIDPVRTADRDLDPAVAIVIDAVRTVAQAHRLSGLGFDSTLVHLSASEAERARRYAKREEEKGAPGAEITFEAASAHETERSAEELRNLAHLVLDTTRLSVARVKSTVLDFLQNLT